MPWRTRRSPATSWTDGSGGGVAGGGGTNGLFVNVTVASNSAGSTGGIDTDSRTLRNTIVAGKLEWPVLGLLNRDLEQLACLRRHVRARRNRGSELRRSRCSGRSRTTGVPPTRRSLGPTSPATNTAAPVARATDQRGVSRPQGGVCDIGAYEYRPPRLTVIKKVVNNDGGTATAADFSVHVLLGGNEVAGSPQPGSATGTTYTLSPGSYAVGEFTDARYVGSFSGDCAANGAITLAEGQVKTCTITNNDKPPVVGKIVNASPRAGP